MNKFKYKIRKILYIDIIKFIKYNFFSKNIIREKNTYLIPYKGTVIELDKTARIYIKRKNIVLCDNKLRKSNAETQLKMGKNAKWYSNNGAVASCNTLIVMSENAVLNTEYFTLNIESEIAVSKKINIGEDVMMGRNVIIYDSDYHQVFNKEKEPRNYPKEVNIGDHVWLTTNVTVLKGVTIGENSIISAQTLIRKDIPKNSIVASDVDGKVVSECYGWSRESLKREKNNNTKQ